MIESLSELVSQIEEKKAIAEMNPRKGVGEDGKEIDITNPSVIRQKEGNKKQAKEALKDLYMKYRKSVMNHSIFMVAVGSTSEKFGDKSAELFGTYSHPADGLYQSLIDQVPKKLYTDILASRQLFDHLAARFEDRASDIDIQSYNRIMFKQKYKRVLKGREDLVKMVIEAFNEDTGTEAVGLDAIEKTAVKAVNDNFEGAVVPILLHTKDLEFAKMLAKDLQRLSPNVVLIKTGNFPKGEKLATDLIVSKITDKSVEEAMKEIKDRVM